MMKKIIPLSALFATALAGLSLTSCDSYTAPSGGASSTIGGQGQTSRLKLKNKLYTDIEILLEGPEKKQVTVPARSSRSLELKSGIYHYSAGAKEFRPVSRYKVLEANCSYTLYF